MLFTWLGFNSKTEAVDSVEMVNRRFKFWIKFCVTFCCGEVFALVKSPLSDNSRSVVAIVGRGVVAVSLFSDIFKKKFFQTNNLRKEAKISWSLVKDAREVLESCRRSFFKTNFQKKSYNEWKTRFRSNSIFLKIIQHLQLYGKIVEQKENEFTKTRKLKQEVFVVLSTHTRP